MFNDIKTRWAGAGKYINILWVLAGLLVMGQAYAQQTSLPDSKYRSKLNWRESIRASNEVTGGFFISYGYHQSRFFSARFDEVLEDKTLKPAYGDYLQFGYIASPFVFQASWFSSSFKVDDSYPGWPYADTIKVKHRGWEFGIDYIPIQQGLFSKYIVPYLGAGYQVAFACASCGWRDDKEARTSVNASTAIWKAGLLINFTPIFGIKADYKQSFSLTEKTAFHQAAVGILLRANPYSYY